ncbi:MAG: macro domain-containing protein [Thermodesulfobacteriota bacterium]
MIHLAKGNILKSNAEALVNTVNCVGVMGKGIALQFKKAFPDNYKAYEKACKGNKVKPGKMFIFKTGEMYNPKYIINFPTKIHWKGKSKYEYIEAGLEDLKKQIIRRRIASIAIPPLGSGLGGLNWNRVRSMIEAALEGLPKVQIYLFEPKGAPKPEEMPNRTSKPNMTEGRALFIKLIQQYLELEYRLTLLEIQKLAYFLQEAGQNMRLHYVKHLYGPFAHNLNKALEHMEGHYISGYGDSPKPDIEIKLLPGAVEQADEFLKLRNEDKERLEEVASLVDGFETPYGMELLSSVHWLAAHEQVVYDSRSAIEQMGIWNDRKRRLFKPEHVKVAWDRIQEKGWNLSSGKITSSC